MRSPLRHIPTIEAAAILASVAMGLALLIIKFLAYYLTASAAIFSDAVESIANVLASAVAFYSLYLAHQPADPDHPYGHGKVEFLSASFEGGMIFLAAVFITVRTAFALWTGRFLNFEKIDLGLALIIFAMLANGAMGFFLLRVGQHRRSMTLEADGRHLLSDAYTSIAVLVALGLVRLTGWRWFDPITALLIAFYIAWMAGGLLRRASAGLMDKQNLEQEKLIRQILDSHVGPLGAKPHICSYHKMRHRHSGRYLWVDFHIMVPPALTVEQGHKIASAIEYEIEQKLGGGNATAHIEPCHEYPCGEDCKFKTED